MEGRTLELLYTTTSLLHFTLPWLPSATATARFTTAVCHSDVAVYKGRLSPRRHGLPLPSVIATSRFTTAVCSSEVTVYPCRLSPRRHGLPLPSVAATSRFTPADCHRDAMVCHCCLSPRRRGLPLPSVTATSRFTAASDRMHMPAMLLHIMKYIPNESSYDAFRNFFA